MKNLAEVLCQSTQCAGQDRWSPVDEKTTFCRYCGTAYTMDISFLTRKTKELNRNLGRIHDRFGIGALLLTAGIWFLMTACLHFFGVSSGEEAIFLVILVLYGSVFLMLSGIVISFLVQSHEKSKFPELFKKSNWR